MLAAFVVALRSLALICGGRTRESRTPPAVGDLQAQCNASPTPPPRSTLLDVCSPTRGGIGAQPSSLCTLTPSCAAEVRLRANVQVIYDEMK
jgi:hypothetical protein